MLALTVKDCMTATLTPIPNPNRIPTHAQPIEGGRGRCVCGSELCALEQPLCLASAADPFDNQCAPAGTPALPACASPRPTRA